MKFCAVLTAAVAVSVGFGQGPLSGVSIPVGSQDAGCFPVWHNVYSVSAPPYALNVDSGIGNLVKGAAVSAYADFSMHDHVYTAPQVPNPARAVVDYTFRWPVAVYGVEIIQHTNGVTKIEGFAGNSPTSLSSVGQTFGPAGDIAGFNLIPEFSS
jgi:hypothetical protein